MEKFLSFSQLEQVLQYHHPKTDVEVNTLRDTPAERLYFKLYIKLRRCSAYNFEYACKILDFIGNNEDDIKFMFIGNDIFDRHLQYYQVLYIISSIYDYY